LNRQYSSARIIAEGVGHPPSNPLRKLFKNFYFTSDWRERASEDQFVKKAKRFTSNLAKMGKNELDQTVGEMGM
jgi:hypothetical protein